jgi:hypothetical protein
MCYIDGQNNKYSVSNECNRMLKYNVLLVRMAVHQLYTLRSEMYRSNQGGCKSLCKSLFQDEPHHFPQSGPFRRMVSSS